MKSFLYATASAFALILIPINSYAENHPSNWPWHGVTVNNLSFQPERLSVIKKELPGLNSIRLTLMPLLTQKRYHVSRNEAWNIMAAWVDKMLQACAKNNVVAVVSIQKFPIAESLGNGVSQSSPSFWSSNQQQSVIVDYVSRMARELSHKGKSLAAFEVISEPLMRVGGRAVTPPNWHGLEVRIVKAVRKYTNKWVVVTAGKGGEPQAYADFKPLNEKNIVYGAHMYEPYPYTLQGLGDRSNDYQYPGYINGTYWNDSKLKNAFSSLRKFQEKYRVPVWIGEFSAVRWAKGSGRYLSDIVNICNSYNWGWAYFNIGGFNAWDPDYGDNFDLKRPQKVGLKSNRWQTLKRIFKNSNRSGLSANPASQG